MKTSPVKEADVNHVIHVNHVHQLWRSWWRQSDREWMASWSQRHIVDTSFASCCCSSGTSLSRVETVKHCWLQRGEGDAVAEHQLKVATARNRLKLVLLASVFRCSRFCSLSSSLHSLQERRMRNHYMCPFMSKDGMGFGDASRTQCNLHRTLPTCSSNLPLQFTLVTNNPNSILSGT